MLIKRLSRVTRAFSTSSNVRRIYLDSQSSTKIDPQVLKSMIPIFETDYGNSHSRTHSFGWKAETHVENARKSIADLINADSKSIIFTSGATESNNLAIKGVIKYKLDQINKKKSNEKVHIITSAVEHKCVLSSIRALESEQVDVTVLPVEKDGSVNITTLEKAIKPNTVLISIIMVNNEVGTINEIQKIGELCRSKKIYFHTDAAQGVGKIPIDVLAQKIDLMSISAHKMYGPMGVGALFVGRSPRVRMRAILDGGGQERGLRSGTLPVPLIVGFGEAAKVAKANYQNDTLHIKSLYNYMWNELQSRCPYIELNGSDKNRYFGNLNVSFAAVEGESLIMALASTSEDSIKDASGNTFTVAVSSGSACTSDSLESSYVLKAMGVPEELSHTSIRMGFSKYTTLEEVKLSTEKIITSLNWLRSISAVWEVDYNNGKGQNGPSKIKWT